MNSNPSLDWLARWESLVLRKQQARRQVQPRGQSDDDEWHSCAEDYARNAPLRDEGRRVTRLILSSVCRVLPNAAVLDIGAGTGVWAVPLARWARRVTALEPSAAMRAQLEKALAAADVGARVTVVPRAWPCPEIPPHDVALCAHVMYGIADFRGWIDAMTACARELCLLLLRAPVPDDFLTAAARVIGEDRSQTSPDAFLALNALWQMGLRPHLVMETAAAPYSEVYADLPAALAGLKRLLHLGADRGNCDQALTELLERRLRQTPEGLCLPPRPPTAIILWQPPEARHKPLEKLVAISSDFRPKSPPRKGKDTGANPPTRRP